MQNLLKFQVFSFLFSILLFEIFVLCESWCASNAQAKQKELSKDDKFLWQASLLFSTQTYRKKKESNKGSKKHKQTQTDVFVVVVVVKKYRCISKTALVRQDTDILSIFYQYFLYWQSSVIVSLCKFKKQGITQNVWLLLWIAATVFVINAQDFWCDSKSNCIVFLLLLWLWLLMCCEKRHSIFLDFLSIQCIVLEKKS